MLHEKGLNINLLDKNNNNILLLAAKQGVKNNLRYVKKLIELGADPNLSNLNKENFYSECKKQALSDEGFTSSYVDTTVNENYSKVSKSSKDKRRFYNTIISAVVVLLVLFLFKKFN
jgi:ankyrin repeat protein